MKKTQVNRENMFCLNRWAKGKPQGLVIIAQQLAIGTESCFKFLKMIKSGEKIEALSSLQKTKEWVRLYRNHRQMIRPLIECLRRFGKKGKFFAELAEGILLNRKKLIEDIERFKKRFKKMRPFEQRKFISEGQKQLNWVYSLHVADIVSDIEGKVDENFDKKVKEALNEPEINFYFRAWIPCWLLYGEYPPKLLRRARLGDKGPMEKLLRLDTRVLNDTKIGEYFHQAKEKGKRATVDWLTDVLRKGPKSKIDMKKVKCSIAGLISGLSIRLGHRLTEPEIRKLYDAIAQDKGKGYIDTDIPETPWAFAKAIQRERTFWMPTIQPDKK